MKKYSLAILIFTSAFIFNNIYGQTSNPKFSGIINRESDNVPDSIIVTTYEESNMWGKSTFFSVKIGENKEFNFELPEIMKPALFKISLVKAGKQYDLGRYYAEPNDQVYIKVFDGLNKDLTIFSGVGAEKYNLTENINRQFQNFLAAKRMTLKVPENSDTVAFNLYFKQYSDLIQYWADKKSGMVNKSDLKPTIKSLLLHEYGRYNEIWNNTIDYIYRYDKTHANNDQSKSMIRKNYNLYNDRLTVQPDTISVLCPSYFITLAFSIKVKAMLNSGNGKVAMKTYYDDLKNSYTGKIRERLLAEFFISNQTMQNISDYDPDVYDSLVVDAGRSISNRYYKAFVNDKMRLKNGSKLHPFEFKDLNGKTINSESLKGKVFLIEVWTEGCGGCAEFHNIFEKKISPYIDNNEGFVVLSVSLNRTREGWIRSLNSGLYSSKHYLNVSAGALNFNHPFFKYYGFNAVPLVLLVDKQGNLITKLSGAERPSELIAIISSAMNKPYLK